MMGFQNSWSEETKKLDRHMLIEPAQLPESLIKNSESIQQVIIRSVMLSKQFELIFGNSDNLSQSKLRVYNLKINIENTDKIGFYDVSLDLQNPKINKTIKLEKEAYVNGKRLLHTLRVMVLRMIYGEAYIRKNTDMIEKLGSMDPLIKLPEDPNASKSLPPAKKVKDLQKEKKNYDESRQGLDKKPNDPSSDKKAPAFRDRTFAFGTYYQKQTITSNGTLLNVNNNFNALLVDVESNTSFDKEGDNIMVLSGRYGKTLTKYTEKIPDSFQMNALYDRHLFSFIRALGGLRLDRASFANLPVLNSGIKVGSVNTIWGMFGLETSFDILDHRLLFNGAFLKSLKTSVSFPNLSDAAAQGSGMVSFLAYEILKKYYLAIEFSKIQMDVVASKTFFSNSDDRISFGLFYSPGEK
jgi:hypothetical protein